MRAVDTTSKEFFEQKYVSHADPWKFATADYEQRRYATILGGLGERRFERAFEPGCSIGVLTEKLAERCSQLIAMDISPTAAERAQQRCEGFSNVAVVCGSLPEDLPPGKFDLIVFSEMGYYFEKDQLMLLAGRFAKQMSEGGVLLACHWRGFSEDHLLSGDEVHQVLGSVASLQHDFSESYAEFRLDRWTRQ